MRRLLVLLIGLWAVPSWALTVTGMTPSTYTVATLTTGSIYYVDRTYTLTSIPASIGPGATWIKTANTDKTQTAAVWLTFTTDQAVTLSVAYSASATTLPAWLTGWTNTGQLLQTTDVPLRVYQTTRSAGTITLGGNLAPPAVGSTEHYVVAMQVLALPAPGLPGAPTIQRRDVVAWVLTWQDNATTETTTEIERRAGAGPYGGLASVLADAITYTDASGQFGTAYCYRVRACNSAGCSGYSNEACTP